MKPSTPTTRSEMGDWITSHPTPKRRAKRLSTKDQRIAELEAEVRALKAEIEQARIDRALMDPKTGRPRDLICRR